MALSKKVGNFKSQTSTGNFSVTGLGFQPKILILFGNYETGDGTTSGESWMYIGYAISSSSRCYTGYGVRDVVSPFAARKYDETKCYGLYTSAGLVMDMDLVSMDSDGFTLNQTTTDGVARIVSYIAFTSATLRNYTIGNGNVPSSAINFNTTLSYFPDMMMWNTVALVDTATSSVLNTAHMSIAVSAPHEGVFSSPNQLCVTGYATSTLTTVTRCQTRTSAICLGKIISTPVAYNGVIRTFPTFVTNSWVTDTDFAAWRYHYLAVQGINARALSFSQPTATGNQSYIGLGFKPDLLIIFSNNNVAAQAIRTHLTLSYGATDGVNQQHIFSGVRDNRTIANESAEDLDSTHCVKMFTNQSALLAAASIVSMDDDGFTLNWDTADATARTFMVLGITDKPMLGSIPPLFGKI